MKIGDVLDSLRGATLDEFVDYLAQASIHDLAQDRLIIGGIALLAICSLFKGWRTLLTFLLGLSAGIQVFVSSTEPGANLYDLPMEKMMILGGIGLATLFLCMIFLFTSSEP